MSSPKVGEIFQNRYLILAEIGAGGMGLVYRARQLDADREVALKLLRREKLVDAESVARFYREFKLLSRLCHPHILLFYSLALDDKSNPFAVCEYIEGKSLRSLLLEEGHLSWERAVKISIQICEAMQYIHENGIVHRDLKPDNVMLQDCPSPDFVKLLDFGLSGEFISPDGAPKITWTGQLMGSANYMAPELARKKADARSDIYALGCLLFEMLAGEALFCADNSVGVLYRHSTEDPAVRFLSIGNKVPAGLLELLARSLAKEPEHRYQSMKELGDRLKAILADPETLVLSKNHAVNTSAANTRTAPAPVLLSVACVFLLFAAGLVCFAFWQRSTHRVSEVLSPPSAHRVNNKATTQQMPTIAGVEARRDEILSKLKSSKSAIEREHLRALLPDVLVELARMQFLSNQKELALSTLAAAKKAMRKDESELVRRRYYFLHAMASSDPKQIEDDISQGVEGVEALSQYDSGLYHASIFAAGRLLAIGRYAKAEYYVDRAIERARTLPKHEDLIVPLALKISIMKHLDSKVSSDKLNNELNQLIRAERGADLILDQARFVVYEIGALEAAELLLEDSISCLQKSGKDKLQVLPACIYLLEKVHARLGKSEAALADFDSLLSLYDKFGPLLKVPTREVIAKERSNLAASL